MTIFNISSATMDVNDTLNTDGNNSQYTLQFVSIRVWQIFRKFLVIYGITGYVKIKKRKSSVAQLIQTMRK